MKRTNSFQSVFNEPFGSYSNQQEFNFLQVEDIFEVSIFAPEYDLSFENNRQAEFQSFAQMSPIQKDSTLVEPLVQTPLQSTKHAFKSSYSKNVCYNICQKTIKVVKKGVFDQKLQEICQKFNLEKQKFKADIVKKKKDFTGPKALSSYIEKKTNESKVFGEFMKWFLTQKYLRMAINEGEMKNLKVYIQFKNVHILPLLG